MRHHLQPCTSYHRVENIIRPEKREKNTGLFLGHNFPKHDTAFANFITAPAKSCIAAERSFICFTALNFLAVAVICDGLVN